ncbi:hypothetical protein GBA52_019902 [Prunus armeniaca]|nr:hypothetical protein GBA52_019902 [Prunus armeniaca]
MKALEERSYLQEIGSQEVSQYWNCLSIMYLLPLSMSTQYTTRNPNGKLAGQPNTTHLLNESGLS